MIHCCRDSCWNTVRFAYRSAKLLQTTLQPEPLALSIIRQISSSSNWEEEGQHLLDNFY